MNNQEIKGDFPIINMKVIKILFNRAYRLKRDQPDKALTMFKELLDHVDKIIGGDA